MVGCSAAIDEELHMHATFAYLNAAGRRATRLTPSNGAFMRVMDTLLAGLAGAQGARPRKKTSPRPIRKTGEAGSRSRAPASADKVP